MRLSSRPARRNRLIGRLLTLLVIVLSMTTALPPAVTAMPSAATAVKGWQIEWTLTASGELREPEMEASRRIAIHVSAQVYRTAHGWEAQPFSATVIDDREERHISKYYSSFEHEYIIDPDRYSRGPDPVWGMPMQFEPDQQDDGSWTFPTEAFGTWFAHNNELSRDYTYRRDFRDSSNGALPPSFSESTRYVGALLNTPWTKARYPGIPGDATGTTFALATTYQADELGGEIPLAVAFNLLITAIPGEGPTLALDREFLERSVFLDRVPVDHWFDANVSWGDANSGFVTWRVGPKPFEQVGQTSAATIRRTENLGALGVGPTTLSVQARNSAGIVSLPETTRIMLAPIMEWCGGAANVTGTKLGPAVSYRCGFKFPEPAFKADPIVPAAVPFFGGKELGIRESQLSMDLEVKSTGEGSVKGAGQAGFAAMGGSIIGALAAKGDVVLDPGGVRIPQGALELAISGKLEKEEPLLKAVPAFLTALTWLESVNRPAAHWLASKAYAKLELEPKIAFGFNFENQGQETVFKNGEATPSVGFKVTTALKLIEEELELRAGVGGESAFAFQVPKSPGYLKQIDLKFLTFYQLQAWRFLLEGEKAWTWSTASSLAALGQPAPSLQVSDGWKLMDRSYLLAPDYASWTGTARPATGPSDLQLMQNVDPLADPALATRSGVSQEFLIWAHDKPGSPALSGQELAFARGNTAGWAEGWKQLTNDDLADFNPQLVTLPNGRLLALWQRLDTPMPGDLNTDARGFFSHQQIAAGSFDPANPQLTPRQLSAGGSLNHRPHLGALSDGALALWIANPGNQILGSAESPDQIMWARYTQLTDGWSVPAPLVANVSGLLDVELATAGTSAALVYTQDLDGDLATDGDQELFYVLGKSSGGTWSWDMPVRLTDNTVADEDPQIALSDTGAPLLVWSQAGQLSFVSGSWAAAPQPLSFGTGLMNARLVRGKDTSLALVWQQVEHHDTRIGYAIYDGKQSTWSDARTIEPPAGTHTATGTSALVTRIAPSLVTGEGGNDTLVLAYQLANVDPITRTVEGVAVPNTPQVGAHHLRVTHVPLGPNLQIKASDLRVTPDSAQAGAPAMLQATIHNTGGRTIANATVELMRKPLPSGVATTLQQQPIALLSAGGTSTISFVLEQPAQANQQFVIRVKPPAGVSETDTKDNEAALGMELSVEPLSTHYAPGTAMLQAQIQRHSVLPSTTPVSATIMLGAPNGPVLREVWFSFPVTPTASISVTASIPVADLGPGRHILYWNIDPAGRLGEQNREDNSALTSVTVLPDLTTEPAMISFDQSPGSAAPVRLWVSNLGSQQSGEGVVEIFTGPPGQEGARSLGRLALPALQPDTHVELQGTLELSGLPAARTGLQSIYVQIDPADALPELNENNNGVLVGSQAAGSGPARIYLPLLRR